MKRKAWWGIAGLMSTACEWVAGVAVLLIMLLTGGDIIGRLFGRPIPGTYELVSFAGGVIAGMAMPATARAHGHVYVDLITANLSVRAAHGLNIATRLLGIAMLLIIAWGIAGVGNDLRESHEVSAVLALPFYPVAYGMACAFALSCVAMLAAVFEPASNRDE